MIGIKEAAERLKKAERVLILSHQFPDGDTLGCAAALCRGLRRTGRRAAIRCSDKIGPKFNFLFHDLPDDDFTPDLVVAVDIADEKLLGEPLQTQWGGKVELCIDHHPSNTMYAEQTCLNPKAAATCEIIYDVLREMGVAVDKKIATPLYTGITTDTGCFKYINVTPRTYRIAADLVETGVDAPKINREMFDTKSRARLDVERRVLDSIRYDCGGKVAVIVISRQMVRESGACEDDLDGLATIPRGIEGVQIGVTLREKEDGAWKVSLRALPPSNASEICERFGGGGHPGAAGCTLNLPLEQAREQMLCAVREYLEKHG
ncbi:MAG: bifunctional oligoribonuclease/PAP phosphatase NrnA [Oscillospiraceae bacterium]|jgi:phosphoesterase RecJ-like protein|nr:bifunctional oligoribonuclease/PAP phosphatase NrnA [Oscillospiraceae bacterium]